MRAFLGFVAAAIAVLTFHQGMLEALHEIGWVPFAWYRTTPVAPFGVPVIVSLCFWGGLYGGVFGLLLPRFTWPYWLCGLILGVIASLVGMFIVAPIKGLPIAGGWVPFNILRSLVINGFWGIGVGLILPLLMPRSLVRAHP
jgi:tetrahydromethanopterin S-methyltransferase subunit C